MHHGHFFETHGYVGTSTSDVSRAHGADFKSPAILADDTHIATISTNSVLPGVIAALRQFSQQEDAATLGRYKERKPAIRQCIAGVE